MLMLVRLKKTSGNLEGLALSLPKYESSEYKSYQIHSMSADHDMRVYGAIHGKDQADRTLVLCPNQDLVKSVLDGLDGGKIRRRTTQAESIDVRFTDGPFWKFMTFLATNSDKALRPIVAKIVKSFLVDIRDAVKISRLRPR